MASKIRTRPSIFRSAIPVLFRQQLIPPVTVLLLVFGALSLLALHYSNKNSGSHVSSALPFETKPSGLTMSKKREPEIKAATPELLTDEDLVAFRSTELELSLGRVTDFGLLHNASTPQGRAFRWLVHDDDRRIEPDDPNVLQRYVLATLFFATNGPKWHHGTLHWLSRLHECHWFKKVYKGKLGVKQCNDDMKVTALFLAENNLLGSLPAEIGLLEQLSYLDLQNNHISGSIPPLMGRMQRLEYLALSSNEITGNLPESISTLRLLEELLLHHNHMAGNVPRSICQLRERGILRNFWADCNQESNSLSCNCCTVCCNSLSRCRPPGTGDIVG